MDRWWCGVSQVGQVVVCGLSGRTGDDVWASEVCWTGGDVWASEVCRTGGGVGLSGGLDSWGAGLSGRSDR